MLVGEEVMLKEELELDPSLVALVEFIPKLSGLAFTLTLFVVV